MKIGEISIQRFRIPKGISPRMFILDPHPEGEWVSYADFCKAMETLLKAQEVSIPTTGTIGDHAIIQCGARIEILESKGRASTYCMKPLGHEGKHE